MAMIRAYGPAAVVAPAGTYAQPGKDHRLSPAVMFYFLMIALPIEFYVGSIFMTGVRVVLLVVAVPLSLRLFGGQFGRILLTDILLLAYGIWGIGTLFVNSPDQAVSFGGSYMLEVYGSYLLARAHVRTPEQFRAACKGLFLVLLFSMPFALYETRTGVALLPRLIDKLPGIFSVADFYNEDEGKRMGLERSQVIFAHPIHYGVFCGSLFSLAIVGFKGSIPSFRRYVLGGLALLGVVVSVSSGAILPMMMQFLLVSWGWMFDRVRTRWLILSGLVAVCYVIVDVISNRTAIEVLLEYGTFSPGTAYGRILIFEWGMDNVRKHPFLGLGLNDWERPWWKISSSMDNFWLLSTVRYGIPGFLLLIISYLAMIWGVMRRDVGDAGEVWQYRRAWVFTQIAMVLALCTVDVWATVMSYTFFLFGMGAWFVTAEPPRVAAHGNVDTVPPVPSRVAAGRYTRFPAAQPGRQDRRAGHG